MTKSMAILNSLHGNFDTLFKSAEQPCWASTWDVYPNRFIELLNALLNALHDAELTLESKL